MERVSDVGVIAGGGAVAEHGDGLTLVDALGEFVNGEVRALSGSVDGEKAEHGNVHAVNMMVGVAQGFAGQLAGGVGGDGLEDGVVLAEGNLCIDAIDGGGTGDGDFFHLPLSGGLEDIYGALDVDPLVEGWLFEAGPNPSAGGEVDDLIKLSAGKDLFDLLGNGQVALDEGEGFGERLDVADVALLDRGGIKIIEIVEGDDLMALVQQFFTYVGADEAGAACYQKIHGGMMRRREWSLKLQVLLRVLELGAGGSLVNILRRMSEPLMEIELPGIPKVKSGKVREVFDLGDCFLFVASDRISAFDVIMPNGIPRKGEVLTQLSHFWFERTAELVPNHLLAGSEDDLPARLQPFAEQLAGRSMLVKKCQPLAIECVVRGYLAGSGWKEYQQSGRVCGIELPEGLVDSSELAEPIFTPATKAEEGHDENISFEQAAEIVGQETVEKARDLSLKIYSAAREFARGKGIIIADTKFEFGLLDGELILIDEVLTSDSSRFWPADQYEAGRPQSSFDKQFLRDYLESLDWDKQAPGPELPPEIVAKTQAKYFEAYELLTGRSLG